MAALLWLYNDCHMAKLIVVPARARKTKYRNGVAIPKDDTAVGLLPSKASHLSNALMEKRKYCGL